MAQAETIPSRADDSDPLETAEWLESLRSVLESQGPERVSFLLGELSAAAHRDGVETAVHGHHAVYQHHPRGQAAAVPRQPRDRAPHQEHHPLERHGHGRPGQPRPRRHRRAHLHVRLGGHAVRSRASTTSSTARATTTRATRSTFRVTPRRACTRGRFSRAGFGAKAPGELSPGVGGRRRAVAAIRIPG